MFGKPLGDIKPRPDIDWYGQYVVIDDVPGAVEPAAELVRDAVARSVAEVIKEKAEVIVQHLESGQVTVGVRVGIYKADAEKKEKETPDRKELIEKIFVSKLRTLDKEYTG